MTGLNSTGGAAATAAGMITITGGVLGMNYDALIMGFLGGLVWLSFASAPAVVEGWKTYRKAAVKLFASTLMAGAFASVGAAIAADNIAGVKTLDELVIRSAAAFAIGLLAHPVIPWVLNWLRVKLGGQTGENA